MAKKCTTVSAIPRIITMGYSFRTITSGSAAFGLTPTKRGWQILAEARFKNAPIPNKALKDVLLWFPNVQNTTWNNCYHRNTIIEEHKDAAKNLLHVKKLLKENEVRITFLKDNSDYRYVGVYELDKNDTRKRNVCVWKRVLTDISSDLSEVKSYIKSRP